MIEDLLDRMVRWWYEKILAAATTWVASIGNMGADLFNYTWVKAFVTLFSWFGFALFVIGCMIALFDFGMAYRSGQGKTRNLAMNIFKGMFASALFASLPVELYKFCISLQSDLLPSLLAALAGDVVAGSSIGDFLGKILLNFTTGGLLANTLISLVILIAFIICVVKVFFANIKRGGILLIQICVGSLYMFSVPRGYTDGFWQWCNQIIALCLTAFLQTILLLMGFSTFISDMMIGLGIMLAACEVPKIAQRFGMDTSVKFNMTSTVYAASSAVNLIRTLKPA